ncbi:MAG: 3'-5' exonuclease domain-containing protein 2 [Firmicutes bacterium]|nr:3'-5' exonuclease domain-containing protein 2 [Bacillota bacterium]MCM1400774.1 3'-5' exonuclease domain-containing protein 2 [Bacteroides sp.]MCM1477862.1 3'-5' exonuclease domain-containing protein 2 [Bacteroides sp.]
MNEQFTIAIPKETLAGMPTVEFQGTINLIDTPEAARKALAFLSERDIVGFDTETRPNFRKGQNHKVALVQISTENRCFLFRLCNIGLMPEMCEFFENPNITKIGLSLKDDFHNLHKINEFNPEGFIELQNMVRDYAITDSSLQKIYGILFGQRISKGQRLTNWEAAELTEPQKRYAALDAWACLHIYKHLTSGGFVPEESPYHAPRPEVAE